MSLILTRNAGYTWLLIDNGPGLPGDYLLKVPVDRPEVAVFWADFYSEWL